ncbi:MAG TPA: ferritin-like domain-containing protein [Kofleriaceae bacterium]|nr:ferritin-like domain-containing protein [Kofleriaceae bacterium]
MGALLLAFVFVVVACTWIGIMLVKRGLQRSKDPAIPQARVANPEGADAAYAKAAQLGARVPRKIGKGVLVVGGLALIAAPWVAVCAALAGLSDLGGSKGRVLRIRGRARLPELATGDGWGASDIVLESKLSASERAVLGELWLLTARMEHASVAAFSQLSIHLSALGAPARLLEATHRAALEEIRHAERCFAIARAITGVAHTAGPIPALGTSRSPIDHVRLAVGSLVDGCVAEGIAADVARRGAALAGEPAIRDTLELIAREEAGHAELAWDVLAWCLEVGGEQVGRAVAARAERLEAELAPRMPAIEGIDDLTLARFGCSDQDALGQLAASRIGHVRARACELVRRETRAAA